MATNLEQIRELEKQIRYYSDIYYNGDVEQQETEGISDAEFDELVSRLKSLDPHNPTLDYVGAPVTDERREKLVTPMLSQEKALTRLEAQKCLKRFPDSAEVILEEKLDGCGLDCTYIDGQLVSAVTRGTWIEGTQCLEGAKQIANLPKMFNAEGFKRTVHVRGEVVIKDKDFEEINKALEAKGEQPFSNTRNLAAGTIKLEDMAIIRSRKLYFVAYEFFGDADLYSMPTATEVKTHEEKLNLLRKCGFTTPLVETKTTAGNTSILNNSYNILSTLTFEGKPLPYAIDGIVVKINDQEMARTFGATQHHPKCSFAIKPEAETAWVTCHHVDWTMSRLGTVTPTAVFDKIKLSGADLSRANVHNLNNMKRFNVCPGTRLKIVRSGLVIPRIVGSDMHAEAFSPVNGSYNFRGQSYNEKEFKKEVAAQGLKFTKDASSEKYYVYDPELYRTAIPKEDPSTGSPLVEVELSEGGARVMRVSDAGMNFFAIAKKCEHFLKSIRCLGWGEKLLVDYCYHANTTGIQDFIETMSPQKVKDNIRMNNISDEYAQKLSEAVKKSLTNLDLVSVVKGLGISHAQSSVDKAVKDFKKPDDIVNPSIWSKYVTDGILSYIRKDITDRKEEILGLLSILKVSFDVKETKQASQLLVNKSFVITGTLSRPRKEFEELIKANGGKFQSALSGTTFALIAGEGGGSKRSKAEALGVKVLTEEEFLSMLK